MLGLDYEFARGQRLNEVLGREPLTYNDGSIAFDEILIKLEECALLLSVDDNTDEVSYSLSDHLPLLPNSTEWHTVESCQEFLGSELGWLWIGKNYLGYADMVTISFSGLEPDITLVGAASKLSLYRLHKLRRK